jgi:hypothetical protein
LIHSLFRYAALHVPEHAALTQLTARSVPMMTVSELSGERKQTSNAFEALLQVGARP